VVGSHNQNNVNSSKNLPRNTSFLGVISLRACALTYFEQSGRRCRFQLPIFVAFRRDFDDRWLEACACILDFSAAGCCARRQPSASGRAEQAAVAEWRVGKTERGEEARDAPLRLVIPLYPEVLILQVLFTCAYDGISVHEF
jgi:hypothetical protein